MELVLNSLYIMQLDHFYTKILYLLYTFPAPEYPNVLIAESPLPPKNLPVFI